MYQRVYIKIHGQRKRKLSYGDNRIEKERNKKRLLRGRSNESRTKGSRAQERKKQEKVSTTY